MPINFFCEVILVLNDLLYKQVDTDWNCCVRFWGHWKDKYERVHPSVAEADVLDSTTKQNSKRRAFNKHDDNEPTYVTVTILVVWCRRTSSRFETERPEFKSYQSVNLDK